MPPPSGSTPTLLLPYPVPNDPVDVPRDIKALADKLDSSLGGGGSGGGGVLKAAPVLDVGVTGQVRAGRQLALADFTDLGLSAPAGLWNLSNLTDASGNGRSLSNKGAVPFDTGINGTAATAARFSGSTGQALYIADTGAADPFRIKTGSWGCWFRTAKRGTSQALISKYGAAGQQGWVIDVWTSNVVGVVLSTTGTGTDPTLFGVSDVADDRWHFAVTTTDGTTARLYVDGVLEGTTSVAGLFASNAPLNIAGFAADAGTAATWPHHGRVDEAFVTPDVLSEDQIRVLYAARIVHGLTTTPRSANLTVNRKRKGAALATADFTTTPLRLYNLTSIDYIGTGGGQNTDEGSNGATLTWNSGAAIAGADGSRYGAYVFNGVGGGLSATDAGLPAALTARSYGCWFKTTTATGVMMFLAWGTAGTADARLVFNIGNVCTGNGTDFVTGPFAADGQWHFVVTTDDNAAGDGVRRKMYLDGRLVVGSTVMNPITLAGANRFRIGAHADGTSPFTGQVDGAFVTGYPFTAADIATLYAKSSQGLGASPKNAGDHVEALTATAVYFIGDTLESQHQIDLGVAS